MPEEKFVIETGIKIPRHHIGKWDRRAALMKPGTSAIVHSINQARSLKRAIARRGHKPYSKHIEIGKWRVWCDGVKEGDEI